MSRALAKKSGKLAKKVTDDDLARIEAIEFALQERAAEIVGGTFLSPEITKETEEAPPEWVERFGADGAKRALVVAKAAWDNSKEAPLFVKQAHAFLVGLMKVRAREKQEKEAPPLNLTMVQMNVQLPSFPSRKVDK